MKIQRSRRAALAALALLLAIAAGCATGADPEPPDDPSEPATATVEQGLTEGPPCTKGSTGLLNEWPSVTDDRRCDGAWKWQANKSCTNLACGCQTPATCQSWQHGPAPTLATQPFSKSQKVPSHKECECPEWAARVIVGEGDAVPACPGGPPICETVYHTAEIPGLCEAWRNATAPAEVAARKTAITTAQAADGVAPAGQHLHLVTASAATFTYTGGDTATCRYHVKYPLEHTAQSLAVCGCAQAKHCQDPACGLEPTEQWAPEHDITKNQLRALRGPKVVGAATCSTCEHHADPGARYDCLMQMRQAATTVAARTEIDRTKLLAYEMYGDRFDTQASQARRTDAKATYAIAPELLTCGTSLPNVCNLSAVVPVAQHALLERCTRLLGDHVATALVALELDECLSVAQPILAAVRAGCPLPGGGSLVDDVDAAQEALWVRQLAMPSPAAATADRVSALYEQLRRMGVWRLANYRSEAVRGGGTPPTGAIEADSARALSRWWSSLYARYGVTSAPLATLASTSPSQALLATQLSATRSRTTLASQDVATALLTRVTTSQGSALPLTSFDLFMPLLGDSLRTFADQLDELRTYHDFACVLGPCVQSPSRVAAGYRLIARIERGRDLVGALSALPAGETLAGWRVVFDRIAAERDQAPALTTAWNDFQPDRDLMQVDLPGRPLVQRVVAAQVFDQRYTETGQLDPAPATLNAGQSQDQVAALAAVMQGRVAELRDLRTELATNLVEITRAQIGFNEATSQHASAQKTRERIAQQHADLLEDVAGLQASARESDARFASLVESFRLIESSLDQSQLLRTDTSKRFFVRGVDARYTSGSPVDPGAIDVVAGRVDLDPGQLLQVGVQGTYTPTCTLRDAQLIGAQGQVRPPEIADSSIGPEGYGVVWTGSSYSAESVSSSTTVQAGLSASFEVCTGTPQAGKFATGIEAKFCMEASMGLEWSTSDSSQTGTEGRTAASFEAGLRLAGTPYPEMPAGALLIVTTARGSGALLQVQVAQAGVSTVVPQVPATVRFVVNDAACSGADATSALTVTAVKLTTVQAVAAKVVQAMAEVIQLQQLDLAGYLAQGRVLPSEAAAMRSAAYLALNAKIAPLSSDALPPPLLGLFNAFLDREVLRVERSVELLDLRRKARLLVIELDSLDNTLEQGSAGTQLHAVLLAQLLSRVDEAQLRGAALRLLGRTRDYLYPALKIWYPAELAALAQDALFQQQLAKLSTGMSLEPSASAAQLVAPVEIVVGRLLDVIEDGTYAPVPSGGSKIVRVSFPKPALMSPNPILGSFASGSRTVDGPRAAALWSAILSPDPAVRKRAPVTILPDDIYSRGLSGQGTLPCIETSPVVRRLGFYFGSRDGAAFGDPTPLNAAGRYLGGATPRLQQFLTQAGILGLMLAPGSPYGVFSARVFYGYTLDADAVITAPNNPTRPQGMSPFGTMYLDFESAIDEWTGGIGNGLAEAEELVVVMEVDRAQTGGPPPGVARCADFVPPLAAAPATR